MCVVCSYAGAFFSVAGGFFSGQGRVFLVCMIVFFFIFMYVFIIVFRMHVCFFGMHVCFFFCMYERVCFHIQLYFVFRMRDAFFSYVGTFFLFSCKMRVLFSYA